MPQSTQTILLRGGLNLVSPQVAVSPGQCVAAMNYEPDVSGYRRIVGFERYSGLPSPSGGSDAAEKASRRSAIAAPAGSGPIRGIQVYDGAVYAFRDGDGGIGGMHKSTDTGWSQQSFGTILYFTTGTAEFLEGEALVGGTSNATAKIERAVLQSGTFSGGDAAGYLVVSDVVGTFEEETITSGGGSATLTIFDAVSIPAGGRYDFVNHNFYGAAKWPRMYFTSGTGPAMEWDGEVLAPIRSGNLFGSLDELIYLLSADGDNILSADGDQIIIDGDVDRPTHIGQYANHLFLGFDSGGIIHSGIGEPLSYTALDGAGELPFGSAVTGFLTAASTAFVIFGASRVEYLTGTDEDTFVMAPISDRSGAYEWTAQTAGDQPVYLDEGGIRKLGTTSAFGDWRLGTLTQLIEPLFKAKRDAGVAATASLTMRAKDQYYLFFDDGTGVVIYLGRKQPEAMLFKLPVTVSCACSGELVSGEGERHFIGCTDGYVYEMNRGSSFDGAAVPAFMRLAFNSLGAPSQQKRYHSAEFEIDAPDDASFGIAFHLDYGIAGNPGGAQQDENVAQGSPSLIPNNQDYDDIDWTSPVQGLLRAYLSGIGRNCAISLITEHTDEAPHMVGAMTMNYSPRRVVT